MNELISKKTVLDALAEISREVADGYGFDYAKWREYFCELPPAQFATDTNVGTKHGTNLAEVGTDCISRQDAIDMIRNHWSDFGNADNYRTAKACVDAVPPIRPKRGKWTADNACSECGCQPWFSRDIHNYNFCPNCGADMRER